MNTKPISIFDEPSSSDDRQATWRSIGIQYAFLMIKKALSDDDHLAMEDLLASGRGYRSKVDARLPENSFEDNSITHPLTWVTHAILDFYSDKDHLTHHTHQRSFEEKLSLTQTLLPMVRPQIAAAIKGIIQGQLEAFKDIDDEELHHSMRKIAFALACIIQDSSLAKTVAPAEHHMSQEFAKKLIEQSNHQNLLSLLNRYHLLESAIKYGGLHMLDHLPSGAFEGQKSMRDLTNITACHREVSVQDLVVATNLVTSALRSPGYMYSPDDEQSVKAFVDAHNGLSYGELAINLEDFAKVAPQMFDIHPRSIELKDDEIANLMTNWAAAGILHLCSPYVQEQVMNEAMDKAEENDCITGSCLSKALMKQHNIATSGYSSSKKIDILSSEKSALAAFAHHGNPIDILKLQIRTAGGMEDLPIGIFAAEMQWFDFMGKMCELGYTNEDFQRDKGRASMTEQFPKMEAFINGFMAQKTAKHAVDDILGTMGLRSR